jgi:cell wall-associated NlpC family hydrolase
MKRIRWILPLVLLLLAPLAQARESPVAPTGVPGVSAAQLTPGYWIARLQEPDAVVLDSAAIAARNARLQQLDRSMHDLAALPASLPADQVRGWIEDLADAPGKPLFDEAGQQVPASTLQAILANRALDQVAESPARFALVVRRAALRTFPTDLRVFSEAGDTDIDRFQESALFPGTPVAVVHASADGAWRFVVSPRYAAWIAADAIATGPRDTVLAYATREPYRLVTGAQVRTVFTPEQPALSQLLLDMGTRVPVLANWPASQPVNGQHPYTAHVIELPLRKPDGSLALAPALLQRNTDTVGAPLPLTRANLIRQAFRFLGERYGWGHSYDARDCSGFVSDVYRSMGVLMPRNTRDQAVSPAFDKRVFGPGDDHAARVAAARALEVGDLVYIPGHVMLAIGRVDGEPYVIHDTSGASLFDADGQLERLHLNGVSVTPLLPLRVDADTTWVDRITSIVRTRPAPDTEATRQP